MQPPAIVENSILLGLNSARQPRYLQVGSAFRLFLQGLSGCGKSSCVASIVTGLMAYYYHCGLKLDKSARKLCIVVLDSKGNSQMALDNAGVLGLPVARTGEQFVSVIKEICDERVRRQEYLNDVRKSKLDTKALGDDREFPAILCIIEECSNVVEQVKTEKGDKYAKEFGTNLTMLATQSRSAGISLLVTSHSADSREIGFSSNARKSFNDLILYSGSSWDMFVPADMQAVVGNARLNKDKYQYFASLDNPNSWDVIAQPVYTSDEKAESIARKYKDVTCEWRASDVLVNPFE